MAVGGARVEPPLVEQKPPGLVAEPGPLEEALIARGVENYTQGRFRCVTNGLVIALSDVIADYVWGEPIYSMSWSTANASGAAAHTPAVTGKTWRLPSKDEWIQMFSANGGNNASCTGLNTAITSAGGTALQDGILYWSSTPNGSDIYYNVTFDESFYPWWFYDDKETTGRVRVCLAF